jgi:NADH-quinone oxidoreductase subunit E
MPDIRVLEVATFYTMFNLEPVGKFNVQVCGTTPCVLRGADEIKKVCKRRIGDEHHVTADGKLSWVEVECLGACVNAPMVQVNYDFYEDLTVENFEKIIDELQAGRMPKPGTQIDRQFSAPVGGPTALTDKTLYKSDGGAAEPAGAALTDDKAKRPGEAANVRDAGTPQAPIADNSVPRGR